MLRGTSQWTEAQFATIPITTHINCALSFSIQIENWTSKTILRTDALGHQPSHNPMPQSYGNVRFKVILSMWKTNGMLDNKSDINQTTPIVFLHRIAPALTLAQMLIITRVASSNLGTGLRDRNIGSFLLNGRKFLERSARIFDRTHRL